MKINLQRFICHAIGISFIILFSIPSSSSGKIHNVPIGYQTIQAAIDAALDGDTVIVADGIYAGIGNKNISFLGKSITVKSANGALNCIIDCELEGRGFNFNSNEDNGAVLSGFTIINGHTFSSDIGFTGGGINIFNNSSPIITNCIVTGNQSDLSGAGIYIGGKSSPSISNCIISNNLSQTTGGGIYIGESAAKITGCTIIDNLAYHDGGGISCGHFARPEIVSCIIESNQIYFGYGGGLYAYFAVPTITDSIIRSNHAKLGGGFYFYSCPEPPTVSNCEIIENLAYSGGGLYWRYTSPTIINSRIKKNQAYTWPDPTLPTDSGVGGGIFCGVPRSSFHPSITNSIISKNIASKSGGGMHAESIDRCTRSIFMTNCLISGNKAGQGGGLFVEKKNGCDIAFTFKNCTIAENKADSGGGIYYSEASSKSKIINTIIWGNSIDQVNISNLNVTYSNIAGGYVGLGNIDSQPDFICAVQKNFRLRASSPCIDAGYNGDAPIVDIEGNSRPKGERVDMGVYEGEYTGKCIIPPIIFHMLMNN